MSRRRRRSFVRAGDVRPESLGLPARRARELALAAAWEDAAGSAIVRRVRAVAVRRGTLVLAADEPRWCETMRELLPRLAGRLAGRHPELGIQRVRIERENPVAVTTGAADERPAEGSRGVDTVRHLPPAGDPSERLARAMRSYLERSAQKR